MSATCAVSRKAQPPPPRPPGERDPPAKAMRRGLRWGHQEEQEQLPWAGESAGGEPQAERAASPSDERRRRRQPQEPRALAAAAATAAGAEEEERLEREHFRRIINAFRYYG